MVHLSRTYKQYLKMKFSFGKKLSHLVINLELILYYPPSFIHSNATFLTLFLYPFKKKISDVSFFHFLWQYCIVELNSIVLDVTKEELSPFNNYLLKHLSFSNTFYQSDNLIFSFLYIIVYRLWVIRPYRAPPPQNDRGWVHFFRIGI